MSDTPDSFPEFHWEDVDHFSAVAFCSQVELGIELTIKKQLSSPCTQLGRPGAEEEKRQLE